MVGMTTRNLVKEILIEIGNNAMKKNTDSKQSEKIVKLAGSDVTGEISAAKRLPY